MAEGFQSFFLGGSPLAGPGQAHSAVGFLSGWCCPPLGLDPRDIFQSLRRFIQKHLGHGLRCDPLALAVLSCSAP